MNPLALKRKMFQEMKDVSKSDGADALRAKYGPQESAGPAEDSGAPVGEPDAEPVPGAEGDEPSMDGAPMDGGEEGSLKELLMGMSEDELKQLLAGK